MHNPYLIVENQQELITPAIAGAGMWLYSNHGVLNKWNQRLYELGQQQNNFRNQQQEKIKREMRIIKRELGKSKDPWQLLSLKYRQSVLNETYFGLTGRRLES